MEKLLKAVGDAVLEAGKLMLAAQDIENAVEVKPGDANFVTAYDVAVQKALEASLGAILPEARFIGEESEHGADEAWDGYRFIVDPIDGTTNFIQGYNHSAISVGLCKGDDPVLGVIYNPYMRELFCAAKGLGAFCNGKPIHVQDAELSRSIVAVGTTPYSHEFAHDTFRVAEALFTASLDIRRSASAALDLAYVAAGRIHVFYELRLCPWDYAAGACLVREAGGIITKMDGSPLDLNRPGAMLASSAGAYDGARKVIDSLGVYGV